LIERSGSSTEFTLRKEHTMPSANYLPVAAGLIDLPQREVVLIWHKHRARTGLLNR
jgi:hypothetical protein